MKEKIQLQMDSPPINEVVFGLYLDPSFFDASFFGRYYEKIKDKYPKITKRNPITSGSANDELVDNVHPCMMFESNEGNELIQLQPNRFYFNWRARNGKKYPGFQKTYLSFENEWDRYNKWLKETIPIQDVPIKQLELVYVNHITGSPVLWDSELSGAHEIFSIFNVPLGLNGDSPYHMATQFAYILKNESKLTYQVNSGQQNGKNILILSMTAVSEPDKHKNVAAKWFGETHDYIADFLKNTTTSKAHKAWGLKVK